MAKILAVIELNEDGVDEENMPDVIGGCFDDAGYDDYTIHTFGDIIRLSEEDKKKITIMTSGHYLCNHLPDNYEEMEDEELWEWMNDNAWEPFEHWPGKEVFSCISSAASSTASFIERNIAGILKDDF